MSTRFGSGMIQNHTKW